MAETTRWRFAEAMVSHYDLTTPSVSPFETRTDRGSILDRSVDVGPEDVGFRRRAEGRPA